MAKPAVAWFEITGKDGPKLQQFYSRVFGWQVQDAGDGSGTVSCRPPKKASAAESERPRTAERGR
jgi:predicted enzyme related to lactoylglutathione lyase